MAIHISLSLSDRIFERSSRFIRLIDCSGSSRFLRNQRLARRAILDGHPCGQRRPRGRVPAESRTQSSLRWHCPCRFRAVACQRHGYLLITIRAAPAAEAALEAQIERVVVSDWLCSNILGAHASSGCSQHQRYQNFGAGRLVVIHAIRSSSAETATTAARTVPARLPRGAHEIFPSGFGTNLRCLQRGQRNAGLHYVGRAYSMSGHCQPGSLARPRLENHRE